MLHGWCWWIAVWVVWRGWGRGSWDAAPLSGSRGLSSGWDCQSSHSNVSSGTSEILHLGIGKGDVTQGRLRDTTWTNREAGGAGRDREFTLYPPLQKPDSTEGWQTAEAAKSCFLNFSSPQPFILCRAVSAVQGRALLRQLEDVCSDGCRGSASLR